LAELRGLGGNHQVAHQCQLAAAAEGITAHRRDHGLVDRLEARPSREVVVIEHVDGAGLDHLRDVGAGGEGPVVAGQDHAADPVVPVEHVQGIDQLSDRLMVQRIADLRPIDGDDPYRPPNLGENEFERHACRV